jgi:hypothetical protein
LADGIIRTATGAQQAAGSMTWPSVSAVTVDHEMATARVESAQHATDLAQEERGIGTIDQLQQPRKLLQIVGPTRARGADRNWLDPKSRDCDLGFRCVQD